MAITFTDHSINGKVLNAFNNNVVRYGTSLSKTIVNSEITIGALVFEITPSPDNKFYFNFKTVAKKLINSSIFSDSCPYTTQGELWADASAYLEMAVQYKITFSDATSETSNYTYKFVKGVNQLTEKSFFSQRGTLFPLHKPTNKVAYVTFFKGYPFDISLFGENISIDIDSFLSEAQFLAHDLPAGEVNPQTFDFVNAQGVQRLIICKGNLQWDQIFDKYHNISIGNYEVRMRVEDKCGLYFKWHNEYGGWDYWLFEKNYLVDMSDKQNGEIQMDFDNLPDAKSIVASTGKVVEDSLTLFANGVYDYEIQRVLGIARSPKVYMYTGEKYAQNDDDYWIEVQASVANPQYKQSTFRKTISIKVDIPSNYTLEL